MNFSKGLEKNLPKEGNNGDFYLTEDTGKLFFGSSNGLIQVSGYGPIVNVNCYDSIQSAVDAIPDGSILYLPADKDYVIEKTIEIDKDIEICGGRLIASDYLDGPVIKASRGKIKINYINGKNNICISLFKAKYICLDIIRLEGRVGIELFDSSFNTISVEECITTYGIKILNNSFANTVNKFNWIGCGLEPQCGFYTSSIDPLNGPRANFLSGLTARGETADLLSINNSKNIHMIFNYVELSDNQKILINEHSYQNEIIVNFSQNKLQRLVEIDNGLKNYSSHKIEIKGD